VRLLFSQNVNSCGSMFLPTSRHREINFSHVLDECLIGVSTGTNFNDSLHPLVIDIHPRNVENRFHSSYEVRIVPGTL